MRLNGDVQVGLEVKYVQFRVRDARGQRPVTLGVDPVPNGFLVSVNGQWTASVELVGNVLKVYECDKGDQLGEPLIIPVEDRLENTKSKGNVRKDLPWIK